MEHLDRIDNANRGAQRAIANLHNLEEIFEELRQQGKRPDAELGSYFILGALLRATSLLITRSVDELTSMARQQ